MSDDEQVQRSRIAQSVFDLWGSERVEANAGVIESASQALARIEALRPEATTRLDGVDESDRD